MVSRNKVVLNGFLGAEERWSTSIHFSGISNSVLSGSETLTNWAEFIAAGLDDNIGGALQNALSNVAGIDEILCYEYGPNGPAVAVGQAVADYTGAGTAGNPYQTSLVISSRAGVAGSAYRGRNYWPGIGLDITQNGKVALGTVGLDHATRFAELMAFIASFAPDSPDFGPVIYSPTRGITTPVVLYRVGDVPDVQRRRVDALQEFFISTPYPPTGD